MLRTARSLAPTKTMNRYQPMKAVLTDNPAREVVREEPTR
jgi:hypothetical protein